MFRREQPKVGRNAPCPCGSGQKYKHCHGRIGSPSAPPRLEAIQAALREHEANEIVRTRQQGFGRPIISMEMNGYRIVCVANRVFYGKTWVFFTDFLLHYLKETLGREWGEAAQKNGLNHPIFRWLGRMQQDSIERSTGVGSIISRPEVGFTTALFQLAYSLYLLEHHDQLPGRLVARLRVPSEFRPAMYETIVASAFALAGCKLDVAELSATDQREPEFWATAQSGKKYAVEAKCRASWRSPCDLANENFKAELKTWVRRKLFDASAKEMANPIFWFELSIVAPIDEAGWRQIQQCVREAIDDAEAELVAKPTPPSPAYVFVTNNPHLLDDDVESPPLFAILEPFLIDELRAGRQIELEEAMAIRDRHRDVTWVFECLSAVLRIPQTFDGSVPELLGPDGKALTGLRIGSAVDIDFPDGKRLIGTLTEITTLNDRAWVIVRNDAGTHEMGIIPLRPQEVQAVGAYGEAIFGKPEKKRGVAKDTLALYDWFLEVYATYDREALLRQLPGHPQLASYQALPLAELRVRVAREAAKAAHHRSNVAQA
jgi:SEC-C motif